MRKILCIIISLVLVLSSSISIAYAKQDKYFGEGGMKYWKEMLKQYHKDRNKRSQYLKEIASIKKAYNMKSNFIFLNGEELETDVPPVLKEGRMLVPVRAIVQALGARVQWDEDTKTAIVTKGNTVIKIKLGSDVVYVNGKAYRIDVPARSENNRIVVPVRFIAEKFNQRVEWDEDSGSVIIEDGDENDEDDRNVTDNGNSNLALDAIVKASSVYSSGYSAQNATDGDGSTRWVSEYGDDSEWIYVDLGGKKDINKVKLIWGSDYAKSYKLYKSGDANNWTELYSTNSENGGTDSIVFAATSARYVKLYATARASDRGYSLYEFEVYGEVTDSILEGSTEIPSDEVDLSSEGTRDWAHWGYEDEAVSNHKKGVTRQISDYKAIGSGDAAWFEDNPVLFSWTDGTPDSRVSSSGTGIYITGEESGFEITVPASTAERTLRLYLGAWKAKGKVTASISDGSASPYTAYIDAPSGTVCKVITLDFKAASPGKKMTVKYVLDRTYDQDEGNITLQAATLQ